MMLFGRCKLAYEPCSEAILPHLAPFTRTFTNLPTYKHLPSLTKKPFEKAIFLNWLVFLLLKLNIAAQKLTFQITSLLKQALQGFEPVFCTNLEHFYRYLPYVGKKCDVFITFPFILHLNPLVEVLLPHKPNLLPIYIESTFTSPLARKGG